MDFIKARQRRVTVYKENAERTLAFLKNSRRIDELAAKSLFLNEGECLVPIGEIHRNDETLLERMKQWREEHADTFPTRFPVTREGTRNWLSSQVLDNPSRILFLLTDPTFHALGHLGYANVLNDEMSVEIDNVMRGVPNVRPGLMARAMIALMEWVRIELGPERIFLRVLADNSRARRFYERLGFSVEKETPLFRHESGSTVSFLPHPANEDQKPENAFIHMVYHRPAEKKISRPILTAGPSITGRELAYVSDAVRTGWNQNWAGYLNRFEQSFAEYIGVKYAIATSSCTGALHIALAALHIGPGDEVIIPEITWVATANAVRYVGAIPIFADVEKNTWCLDPQSFQECITPRTKAVIPVHLYGHPARMEHIMDVADSHGIAVVEDAAPSIGAEYNGRRTGTFGDFSAFSFQGAKLAVTGEGGMLLTDEESLFNKAHKIWDQGRVPGTFWIDSDGVKYKMSNIQAALGLAQLERVSFLVTAKRRIHAWYENNLSDIPYISLFQEASWAYSIYWMVCIQLHDSAPLSRDGLMTALREKNIDTRPVFPPISQYPIWGKNSEPKPNANKIGQTGINLPSGVNLTQNEVEYVCQAIRMVLKA